MIVDTVINIISSRYLRREQMFKIQKDLKTPKGQLNSFGGYNYRSCEDIVEAVKPLLFARGLHLNLSDELVNYGDRFYIKATASVMDGEKIVSSASGYAREALTKKGMDESQITGAASSYARKYALNGLFAIDDTKDADTDEPSVNVSNWYSSNWLTVIGGSETLEELKKNYAQAYRENKDDESVVVQINAAKDAKKKLLSK